MNLKNPIQLVTVRDINDANVREAIESLFDEDGISNDTYKRFYPISNDKDEFKARDIVNDWLIKEGYYLDEKNQYFYILCRFDW